MNHIEIRFGKDIDDQDTKEKSFEEMFHSVNPMFSFTQRVWKPQMDIFETREEIIIRAELAGVKKQDIVVEVSSKAVKISGDRKGRQPDRTATYRLAEIQFGRFERVLYLPSVIDVEKASATISNGFLELVLGRLQNEDINQKPKASIDFFKP